jgi:hypothetical protein
MDTEKLKHLDKLPPDVRREFALLANKYGQKKKESRIREDFMSFVKHVWPDFVEGSHHRKVALNYL